MKYLLLGIIVGFIAGLILLTFGLVKADVIPNTALIGTTTEDISGYTLPFARGSSTPLYIPYSQATTSALAITGLVSCDTIDTTSSGDLICGSDASGGGSGVPNLVLTVSGGTTYFQASTTGNAWLFPDGFISAASSTINSTFNLPTLSDGSLVVYGGTVLSNASTTYSGGVAYAGGNVTNTLTAGVGLTRTVDDVFCDNASGSVFGCLLSADWTIFNDKISSTSLSAVSPLGYTPSTGAFTCTGCLTTVDISANTNLGATWPIILTGDTLTFGGLSTSSDAVGGNIPYFSDVNTFANVATATVSCTTGAACTSFDKIGAGAISITTTLGTAVDLASEITGDLPFANLTQGGAYTILANSTGVTADFAAVSTSSIFKDDELSWTTIGGTAYIQPTSTLTIFANNGFIANASSTVVGDFIVGGDNSTAKIGLGTSTPYGNFSLDAPSQSVPYFVIGSTTEVLSVLPSPIGVVGIGTTSPTGQLSIQANASDQETTLFIIASSTATGNTNHLQVLATGGIFAPNLTQSGANQTYYLCGAANTFEMIWDTTTCLISAAKFKKDIQTLSPEDAFNTVMQLKPVTYLKKEPLNKTDAGRQPGFIADDVMPVAPDLVTLDLQGEIHGFRYEQYTAYLTGALQYIMSRVGEILDRTDLNEKQIKELQRQNAELSARLDVLEEKKITSLQCPL